MEILSGDQEWTRIARGRVGSADSDVRIYMGNDEFHHMSKDGDLINDWAMDALRGLIHTDRKGRGKGKESPICQIPWANTKIVRACRWRTKYTRWGKIQRAPMGGN